MGIPVRVQELRKSFGLTQAVRGISFQVERGEVFGLVGPDGAGKTTTMRMLAAILSPDSGTASILGHDSVRNRSAIHDRIAYMSQRFGLYNDLTVAENIMFYADMYGVSSGELSASVSRLLEWSSLAEFKNRPAGKLSGGMKQKLGLACALVHTPELLLLDEPTNGVDPVSRRDFWNLLMRLVEEGLTIVITTSYLDEAAKCGRLAFMDRGILTAAGTPDEITALIPGGVLSFKSETPFADAERAAESTGAISTVFGDEVHVMGKVTAENLSLFAGGTEVRRAEPSVEDAFVYLSAVNSE